MLLSLRDILLLVRFINRWELHCRLRKQVLIFSVLAFFRRCGLVPAFSIPTFFTLANSYLRFQYLHFPSSFAQFHTSHFHTCVFQHPRSLSNHAISDDLERHWKVISAIPDTSPGPTSRKHTAYTTYMKL